MFQLFRSRRPFVAEITDAMGNEIFTVLFYNKAITALLCKYVLTPFISGSTAILAYQQFHLCRSEWQGGRRSPQTLASLA
jgi:hypothetical protein